MRVREAIVFLTWVLMAAVGLVNCDSDTGCSPGELCECSEGTECYLDCEGSGCTQYCHNMPRCGGVCDDDCDFRCHDVDECSSYCGDDCITDCHDLAACGTICGNNCRYTCSNASRCGVVAGSNSVITCNNVATCSVVCNGPCLVNCNGFSDCTVECTDGIPAVDCPGSTDNNVFKACGSC